MYESDPLPSIKGCLRRPVILYETFETADETFDGPPIEQLKQYNVVVWFSGTAMAVNDSKLLTDVDQANLTRYLTDGGHLMLTGQDLIDQSLNLSSYLTC